MEDLRNYTEEDIYIMLQDGVITIEDLDEYIKDGTINAESLELYLKDGLIDIDDLETYIRSGTINTSDIANYINAGVISVDDVAEYIKDGAVDGDKLASQVVSVNDVTKIVTIEDERKMVGEAETVEEPEVAPQPKEEPKSETPEPVAEKQPVVEDAEPVNTPPEVQTDEYTKDTPNGIETPESVVMSGADSSYEGYDNYEDAKNSMDNTHQYALLAGLTVAGLSLTGQAGRGPFISFEINSASRQILNHLMLELYGNNEGIALEFMRDMDDKKETFTISLEQAGLTQEELLAKVKATFDRIQHTIETTKSDMDYELNMPAGLKELKERFKNDDPELGQDFVVGYVSRDGKDSYYVVAGDNKAAMEYARSIGYGIKENVGSNIYELDGYGPKIAEGAVDLAHDPTATDISANGISELDIYGNEVLDPKVEMITNFIATNNDPHLMAILDVEVPANNPSQRIVTMKTEGQEAVVVAFPAQEFDQQVMPKIIDTYAENNDIYPENVSTSKPDVFSRASCQVESSNNTVLSFRGYSQEEVNKISESIASKQKTAGETMENTNVRQKTIGTYPTNNDQSHAFVSMPVLFVICILFILMISLIIFAG